MHNTMTVKFCCDGFNMSSRVYLFFCYCYILSIFSTYFCTFTWQTRNIVILYFDAAFQPVNIVVHCAGPDKWADNYPVANGPRQSPIDIIPKEAVYDPDLKPLKLSYDPANAAGILNNGHSFQVDFLDDTDSSSKLAVIAL